MSENTSALWATTVYWSPTHIYSHVCSFSTWKPQKRSLPRDLYRRSSMLPVTLASQHPDAPRSSFGSQLLRPRSTREDAGGSIRDGKNIRRGALSGLYHGGQGDVIEQLLTLSLDLKDDESLSSKLSTWTWFWWAVCKGCAALDLHTSRHFEPRSLLGAQCALQSGRHRDHGDSDLIASPCLHDRLSALSRSLSLGIRRMCSLVTFTSQPSLHRGALLLKRSLVQRPTQSHF
ncbi:uncharacterized protein C8Q71DRAFT_498358 [Rhodofomes roseus]|uniref:Uncharacterized protein n=1 Tax=Rhodofomes roseus TaxID=34475 RepID=A0ABQ8KMP0_9APHY|nr:uncharacterized protein C8Q71DRAFT_498358 [Rhodofomes roseus]KAH9839135.1 hypothetical protein C8Q71DRAFT_498358 [Rhodofomes roseus]